MYCSPMACSSGTFCNSKAYEASESVRRFFLSNLNPKFATGYWIYLQDVAENVSLLNKDALQV